MADWRVTRAQARERVLRDDAFARRHLPGLMGKRPPLTDEDVLARLAAASAKNAFWCDETTPREIDFALAGAATAQIVVHCVPYGHADICNGGFHQFFSNATGDFAVPMTHALRLIGEEPRAELLVQAMARFAGGVAPRSREARCRALDLIDYTSDWRPWIEPIERAYHALGDTDLYARVDRYAAAHAHELFLDP